MKRVAFTIAIFLAAIALGILLIRSREKNTDVTLVENHVGVILSGSTDSFCWSQSHFDAINACRKDLNLILHCRENVPTDESVIPIMEGLINDSGCRILVLDSFYYGEYVAQIAENYPDVTFLHAFGVEQGDNIITFRGRLYQMQYLCGMLAASVSRTGEIATVAPSPVSEVNIGINAYALGAGAVNPDIKVHVSWLENWQDDERCAEVTRKLLDENGRIDVLNVQGDCISPLEEAQQRGIYSIGFCLSNKPIKSNLYLTSPICRWEDFYRENLEACLTEKIRGGNYWYGVEEGFVELSSYSPDLNTHILREVARKIREMQSGQFDVFYGPIKDNKGYLKVADKETIPDSELLGSIDWYAEGVILHEN